VSESLIPKDEPRSAQKPEPVIESPMKPASAERREPINRLLREKPAAARSWTIVKASESRKSSLVASRPPWNGILKGVFEALRQVLTWVLSFLGLVLQVLLKILSSVDLGNPRVRQGLYWISVGGLMVVVFLAIHTLNVNREAAMKVPVKTVRVVEAPKSPEPETAPAAAEAQTPQEAKRAQALASESAAAAVPSQPQRELTGYGVQVATYVNQEDSAQVLAKFEQAGFSAYVKTQARPEGKHFYSVFLGPFETYRTAQEELAKFKKRDVSKPFQDAFIRPIS
ncbi:MAG: SPOR domain-containing protein, partial [Candidatus Omnitrophota bacterium]